MLVVFFAYFCGGYKNNLRLQISEISLICNMNCILTGSIDANQIKLIERIALVNISILLFWSRSQYVMIVLKIAIRWEVFEISQPAITCSFSLFEQFLYFTRCSSASIVNFEQVNAGWDLYKQNHFKKGLRLFPFKHLLFNLSYHRFYHQIYRLDTLRDSYLKEVSER